METGNLIVDAEAAFARERRRRRWEHVKGRLLRRNCGRLPSLHQVLGAAPPAGRRAVGMRTIPLDSIVGTAEDAKVRAFDHRFRPPSSSQGRWQRLWIAARRGSPLPPVSVFRVGDSHFVLDGHHRVSVAHALGAAAIDAEVTRLD